MNNKILNFTHVNFGKVRMVTVNNKPYAVATDIAANLGYKKPNNAINTHCKHVTLFEGIDSIGKKNKYNVIPEGDIIRLAVKCPLPGADKFESWIFDEVIPSVLNNGAYIPNASPEETKAIVKQFKGSIYLTEEIHDSKSIRNYIREYDKMKLDECIDNITEIVIPMKGEIKHKLLDVAIKELKAIDGNLIKDTIKHTYIKDTASAGIIILQDVKIGKFKKRIRSLEQAV
ncbi:BRO-N domain-containing protein [Clostridium tagluense]|uniref:BRO-N domain-containing protein n=1 Tax=Clostridium tagluense TaxID=360422 RepID=UPI001C6EF66D|nr:Bro-N domain-containing protein [Clostridium tagluense]MBW9154878.1 Bro-N domain-containing protein [Clostridium tagluense]WLC64333.1 Bro-N domain-containing protein [Clostridium tagluense]